MASVQLDPKAPVLAPSDYPNAYAWMQIDAPGYQLDFSPVSDSSMTLDNCRVYGIDSCAVQVCLMNDGPSLQAGTYARGIINESLESLSLRYKTGKRL